MNIPAFNFEIDTPSLKNEFNLTHTEAKVLQVLMQEETATHEELCGAANARVRQVIYSLRGKLRSYQITINSDRDIGYSIPLKYKLRIKNLIEGEILQELNKAKMITERLSHE